MNNRDNTTTPEKPLGDTAEGALAELPEYLVDDLVPIALSYLDPLEFVTLLEKNPDFIASKKDLGVTAETIRAAVLQEELAKQEAEKNSLRAKFFRTASFVTMALAGGTPGFALLPSQADIALDIQFTLCLSTALEISRAGRALFNHAHAFYTYNLNSNPSQTVATDDVPPLEEVDDIIPANDDDLPPIEELEPINPPLAESKQEEKPSTLGWFYQTLRTTASRFWYGNTPSLSPNQVADEKPDEPVVPFVEPVNLSGVTIVNIDDNEPSSPLVGLGLFAVGNNSQRTENNKPVVDSVGTLNRPPSRRSRTP